MSVFDSHDLEFTRSTLEELLPDRCIILSLTNTVDGQGGMTQTWGTASLNVACRIDPGRKDFFESVTGETLKPFTYWILTVPHDTSLTAAQRVKIGTAEYNVETVDTGKSWNASKRAILRGV